MRVITMYSLHTHYTDIVALCQFLLNSPPLATNENDVNRGGCGVERYAGATGGALARTRGTGRPWIICSNGRNIGHGKRNTALGRGRTDGSMDGKNKKVNDDLVSPSRRSCSVLRGLVTRDRHDLAHNCTQGTDCTLQGSGKTGG